jgi:hypothetical protein
MSGNHYDIVWRSYREGRSLGGTSRVLADNQKLLRENQRPEQFFMDELATILNYTEHLFAIQWPLVRKFP